MTKVLGFFSICLSSAILVFSACRPALAEAATSEFPPSFVRVARCILYPQWILSGAGTACRREMSGARDAASAVLALASSDSKSAPSPAALPPAARPAPKASVSSAPALFAPSASAQKPKPSSPVPSAGITRSELDAALRGIRAEILRAIPAATASYAAAAPASYYGGGYSVPAPNTASTDYVAQQAAAVPQPWTSNGSALYYSGGNVGIGTTNPGSFKLHVSDSSNSTSLTGNLGMRLVNTDTTTNNFASIKFGTFDTAGAAVVPAIIGAQYTNHASGAYAGEIFFHTSSSGTPVERMRIASNGNVGIGVTTPSAKLDVRGSAPAGDIGSYLLNTSTNGTASFLVGEAITGGAYGMLGHVGSTYATSTWIYTQPNMLYLEAGWKPGSDLALAAPASNGNIRFFTGDDAMANERVRITSAGNVGIGTSTPARLLTVASSSGRSAYFAGNVGIGIEAANISYGLHLKNTSTSGGLLLDTLSTANQVNLDFAENGTPKWSLLKSTGNDLQVYDYVGGAYSLTIKNTSGNVGIGTTSPSDKLSVVGSGGNILAGYNNAGVRVFGVDNAANMTIGINAYNGSLAIFNGGAGNLIFSGNQNTGIATINNSNSVGGAIDFQARGVSAFYIKENGNVGIGTTTPGAKLVVAGASGSNSVLVTAGVKSSLALHSNSDGSGALYAYDTNGNVISYFGDYAQLSSGNIMGWTSSATNGLASLDTAFSRLAANKLAVGNGTAGDFTGTLIAGNVGVGTSTPTAGYKLHVSGMADVQIGAKFMASNDTQGVGIGYAGINKIGTGNLYIDSQGTSHVILQGYSSTGNVGIGNNAPLTKLQVSGAAAVNSLTSTNLLTLSRPYNPGVNYVQGASFAIGKYDTGSVQAKTRLDINLLDIGGTSDMLPDVTVMSLLGNGNVGIGTTTPGQKLVVAGSAQFTGVISGTKAFDLNLTAEGILTTSASDARLKEDLEAMDASSTLGKIMDLRPYRFSWISDPSHARDVGLIAQDVERVFPEIAFTNPVDGYKGVNYSKLPAILVAGMQEIARRVESVMAWFSEDRKILTIPTDGKVKLEGQFCVDDICMTKAEFKSMMLDAKRGQASVSGFTASPAATPSLPETSPLSGTSSPSAGLTESVSETSSPTGSSDPVVSQPADLPVQVAEEHENPVIQPALIPASEPVATPDASPSAE